MTEPKIEVVKSALHRIEPALRTAITSGWEDWRGSKLSHWRRRGRANYVWEQMAHYAAVALEGVPGVSVVVKHESYHFLVDGTVAFRLKKSDGGGLTRNYPTQEALAFHDPQLPLTGVAAQQRVEVTYCLNPNETDIADILVVGRAGGAILWTYSLIDNDSVSSLPAAQPDAPLQPMPAVKPTGLVRLKGRKTNDDKAGESGES
ncbi:hypothetical protein [Stenotrophomonas sp. JAI102]|uniref:hypothetical protein n=1 Tax=Stenotrophomonas sp. JAI102 TaxID=2723077 RepID=UPI0015CEBF49|nr:hypothetical protein [Stenotrophomonas sp. JAI102]NYF34435.1 hypothetical protein [Stenotrophomonas sp. JAI102]